MIKNLNDLQDLVKKDKKRTLIEHLANFRKKIIYSIIFFIVASGISYQYIKPVVKDILSRGSDMNFVFIAPAELLMSYIKVSLFTGFVISFPYILIQIWLLVSPGLKTKQKRYLIFSTLMGSVFFILGLIFAYIIVIPVSIKFFASFSMIEIVSRISFSNYLSFIINMLIAFGFVFELPIIMLLLVRFRLIELDFIIKNRKYVILIIFVVAAILTPPDVISQVLLGLPMIVLFEIGILISKLAMKNKK